MIIRVSRIVFDWWVLKYCPIWILPSQWSKFKGTHFIFKNQLLITTSKFTEDWINETNRNRLDTIFELYKRGWSNREITDFLNMFGITKRNSQTDYLVKDVFMCLKKLEIRKERLSRIEFVLGEWLVWGSNN